MAARKRLASAKKTTATTTAKTSKPGSKSPRRPPKLSVRGVTDIQRYMLRDIAREKKRKPAAKKAPAKKAPAKKAPAKKAPAKKAPAKKGPAKKAPAKQKPAKQKPAKQVPPARRHARATPNPAIATLLAQEERRAADHQQYIAAAIRNGVTPFQAEINGLNEAQALIRELKRRLYS